MSKIEKLVNQIEQTEALDKPGQGLNRVASRVFRRMGDERKVRDALNGVWLRHPLHPVLVTVPVGAWTIAGMLDMLTLPGRKPSRASTMLVGVGLMGALAAAPAGLADWTQLNDRQRRLGLVHAGLNSISLPFFAISLVRRLLGRGGRKQSFIGLAVAGMSAWMGGTLVYKLQAGVAQRSLANPPTDGAVSTAAASVEEGQMKQVTVDGYPLLVARRGGRVYAMADVCTHLACSLSEGDLLMDRVRCNCHGSEFALEDGRVLHGPATSPVATFDVQPAGEVVHFKEKVPAA